jgi:hypothetical protein
VERENLEMRSLLDALKSDLKQKASAQTVDKQIQKLERLGKEGRESH